jgi:hypothetical protein
MRMLRHMCLAALAIGLPTIPALSAPPPYDSWGKAGVSFDDYRTDSYECALVGHYADVSETDHAKAFITASKRLEAADDYSQGPAGASPADDMYRMVNQGAMNQRIVDAVRPQKRIRELKIGMEGLVRQCLIERGYARFRLTERQQDELNDLKRGSDERHHFLHALASDPAILEQQALPKAG